MAFLSHYPSTVELQRAAAAGVTPAPAPAPTPTESAALDFSCVAETILDEKGEPQALTGANSSLRAQAQERMVKEKSDHRIDEIFAYFDKDKDGYLSQAETDAWWAYVQGRPAEFGLAGDDGGFAWRRLCTQLGADVRRGLRLPQVYVAYLGALSDFCDGPKGIDIHPLVPSVEHHYHRLGKEAVENYGEIRISETDEIYNPADFQLRRNCPRLRRLVEMRPFVLDNSLRETTVAQIRGVTPADKLRIFEEIRRCGITEVIVGCFSTRPTADENFLIELKKRNTDFSTLWGFSETSDAWPDGCPDMETIPLGLRKCSEHGLPNCVIEVDLGLNSCVGTDWSKCDWKMIARCFEHRIDWCREHLGQNCRLIINLRDFPMAMIEAPERVLRLVYHLGRMARPIYGIQLEEGSGAFLPSEIGAWCAHVRNTMDKAGWYGGKFLVHVHRKYGMADAGAIEALASGCDGVWAAICEEGAANGHACSCSTLINLLRLGNPFIKTMFNVAYLRTAANKITRIVTGKKVSLRQEIYGPRALDDPLGKEEDDENAASWYQHVAVNADFHFEGVAATFGEHENKRITGISGVDLIISRLQEVFGEHPDGWDRDVVGTMRTIMNDDLAKDWKFDYNHPSGLGMLFERAGGCLTVDMFVLIKQSFEGDEYMNHPLIHELQELWDMVHGDPDACSPALDYGLFYEGFLGRYFQNFGTKGCQTALRVLDADGDGHIHWEEFKTRAQWVLFELKLDPPRDVEELIDELFDKLLLPMMKAKGAISADNNPDYGSGDNKSRISKTGAWMDPAKKLTRMGSTRHA